jgi:hypothetical protein
MITRLAKWWLTRKGHGVLAPGWRGIALGAADAIWDDKAQAWMVYPHNSQPGQIIALTGSTVHLDEKKPPPTVS